MKPDETNNRTDSIAATAARAVATAAVTALTTARPAADATADACVGGMSGRVLACSAIAFVPSAWALPHENRIWRAERCVAASFYPIHKP